MSYVCCMFCTCMCMVVIFGILLCSKVAANISLVYICLGLIAVFMQMKFVEAILSNNTTDDHCREFVTQKGLVPLMNILSLPNLPLDFPTTHSCQAVASVCKSILVCYLRSWLCLRCHFVFNFDLIGTRYYSSDTIGCLLEWVFGLSYPYTPVTPRLRPYCDCTATNFLTKSR